MVGKKRSFSNSIHLFFFYFNHVFLLLLLSHVPFFSFWALKRISSLLDKAAGEERRLKEDEILLKKELPFLPLKFKKKIEC